MRHVLALLLAENSIADDPKAAAATVRSETDLELAARDLTNAIDDLPPLERPKGWTLAGQDGAP